MSRHRNVRSMNYEEEYYDDDDYYSRSLEDNYCISPSTAAQFTWNRERNINFASYMGVEDVINEVEEEESLENSSGFRDSLNDSASQVRLKLNDTDQARLNSCLEEIHTVLGETVPESVITEVILKNNFSVEKSLNELLAQQDAPKPQREPRNRRNRSQASTVDTAVSENHTATHRLHNPATVPAVVSAFPKQPSIEPQAVPKTVVTPSKSATRATVGFQEMPEGATASSQNSQVAGSIQKSGLKLKIANNDKSSRSVNTDNKSVFSSAISSNVHSSPSSRGASNSKTLSNNDEDNQDAQTANKNLRSAVECMGLEGDEDVIQSSVEAMKPIQSATPKSKSKASKMDVMKEYHSRHGDKELLNLVVIGHVDAGKSTLMGHLLYQLGSVNQKTMHKYEQESKKLGKSSFAFAWVLDETEEERTRGVTMDVAQTRFETKKKIVTLLDAPGHKDFIPNMITGASQADVAILVINATRGEFETGFDAGGQTREHSLLARSLGVGQLIVAVNKMDTVGWSQERYDLITQKLGQFLTKQARFKESDVSFVPCSGLSGENLVKKPTAENLTSWYKPAVTLLEKIDQMEPPARPIDKSFRLNVSDVFKSVGVGFNVAGRVGSGFVQPGDKVLIMPAGNTVGIKSVMIDDIPVQVAFAGDHVNMTLHGIDMATVNIGNALCDPVSPCKVAKRIRAKVVIFNIDVPITKGFPVVFHYQSVNEPAMIKRLISQLSKSTGEVVKKKPRCLTKNTSAVLELEFDRTMCLELYSEFRDLGRFMLRQGGHTIAAGLIEEIVNKSVNGASS